MLGNNNRCCGLRKKCYVVIDNDKYPVQEISIECTSDANYVIAKSEIVNKYKKNENPNGIKAIYPNNKKGIVVVKFDDNTTIKLKCQKEDEFDVYIATALAIAYKQSGSRTHFKKVVDGLIVQQKEKKEKEAKND